MGGYKNYEDACRRIGVPYDKDIKRFIRFLEFDGYTEKGICNAIRIKYKQLRRPMEKDKFYDLLLECVKKHAWSDDDPRWQKIEDKKKRRDKKQEEKIRFKENILSKSYAVGTITGFVYFLQSETNNQIKIGYTRDIHQRIMQLQVNKKDKLRFLLMVPGNYGYEARLHQFFKRHNVDGEWYKPDPEIFNYMDKLRELDKAEPGQLAMEPWPTFE